MPMRILSSLILILSLLSFHTASGYRYSHSRPAKKTEPLVVSTDSTETPEPDDEPDATPVDSLSRAKTLQSRIDEWLAKPHVNRAQWGIRVERLSDRKAVYDRNGSQPLIPASNMKLFSAAAAFEKLGSEFRYRTAFVGTSPLDKAGVLNGNLQIIGSGDPTLSRIFHERDIGSLMGSWADTLIARGLKRITGRVEVPETFWAEAGPAPGWEVGDLTESFAAFPDIVALNDNCFDIFVDPGKQVGDTARYTVEPDFVPDFEPFQFEAVTVPARDSLQLAVIPTFWSGEWKVVGAIPLAAKQSRRRITIRNPREYWRRTMEVMLKARGVAIGQPAKKRSKSAGIDIINEAEAADAKLVIQPDTLWIVESMPMKRIAQEVLKRSHNLSAEHLFRTVGYFESDEWTNESGKAAVTQLMKQWGLDTKAFTIADGSGLSRSSSVPPIIFTQLLNVIASKPWFAEYYEEMPSAGETHTTLSRRRLNLPQNVEIRAKTGTLGKVSTLSGYITSPTDTLTFSILCNHWYGSVRRVKEVQNGILTELAWSLTAQGPQQTVDPANLPDRFPRKSK